MVKRTTRPRRPRPRDPEATRRGILEAAEGAFAGRGFAGTSTRDVAALAGVPQGLIHHHFGSKQALWGAVARRHIEGYLARQAPLLSGCEPDASTLPRALAADFRYWQEHPSALRLLAWASLEGGLAFGDEKDALYAPFVPLVRALQGRGLVRCDVEPLHAIAMCAAAVSFWFQYRGDLCEAMGRGAADGAADDRFLADMLRVFFDGGLGAVARPSPSASGPIVRPRGRKKAGR